MIRRELKIFICQLCETNSACISLLFFRMGASFPDEHVPSSVSIDGMFVRFLFIFLLELLFERVSESCLIWSLK